MEIDLDLEKSIKQEGKVLTFMDSSVEEAIIVKCSFDPDRSPDKSNEDEIGNKPYQLFYSAIKKVRNVLNSLFGRPVQDDREVVDEEELTPAKSNKRKVETPTPATQQKISNHEQLRFRTKFPVLLLMIGLIFCKLMSPVHASDRSPVLAPDRCACKDEFSFTDDDEDDDYDHTPKKKRSTNEYDWSTNPKDMSVTQTVPGNFIILYKCLSPLKNMHVVFLPDNGSTSTIRGPSGTITVSETKSLINDRNFNFICKRWLQSDLFTLEHFGSNNETIGQPFSHWRIVAIRLVLTFLTNNDNPINVWTLHDERGNRIYNPYFKGQLQIVADLKNGKLNVAVNNITLHGRIFVWLDHLTGRTCIPLNQVQGTSVDKSVIQSVEGSTATILFISAVNSVTTFNIKFLNKIIGPSNKYHITNETDGSHTVLSLIINNVSLEDAGIYQCYINNSQQSIDRNLSVSEFRWINKKKDVQAYVGEDARLEWKFRTSLCPDEVLVLKDTGNGLVQWRNGSVVHVRESRLCLNLTRNGSLITILLSIGNLTSEDLNSDYIVKVYFGSHAHIRSPVIYITDGSAVNATSRPTSRPTTSKENHNVTHPPPIVQDEHLAPWIIVIAVVIPLVVIVLIILLIIRYRREITDNIRQLRNRVLDALAC